LLAIIISNEREVIKMNEKEIVIKLMEEQGKTNAQMAAALGISPAAMWDRLNSPKNKSLTISKLNEMLRALDYEIVLMPRAKAGNIKGAFVVSSSGSDK
jgi:transcriptional regulator with XRE-family HTH domain